MTKSERTFQLYAALSGLGFTFEESKALRKIEMTLHRWAEAECNGDIQRDDETGRPVRVYGYAAKGTRNEYPIADREAGALKRLAAIVAARNKREGFPVSPFPAGTRSADAEPVFAYHQTDPRGCALYLVKRSDLPEVPGVVRTAQGWSLLNWQGERRYWGTSEEAARAAIRPALESSYNRGLAVCT